MALASYGIDITILAYAMAGVPIIVVAFNGVCYRNESQVRIYLYYMWITIIALACLIVKFFILEGPCQRLASLSPGATAWACGMARYINIGLVVVCVSVLVYFQHMVYSHCEDLAEMGGGPELADLVLNKGHYRTKKDSLYSTIEGLAQTSANGYDAYMGLDTYRDNGLGGGQNIFGADHEMEFPPQWQGVRKSA